nr:hypothetical protein [Tanacetum cinerariifolium]
MPAGKIGVYTRFFDYPLLARPNCLTLRSYAVFMVLSQRLGCSNAFTLIPRTKIDAFACPALFSWHTGKHVSRDVIPKSSEFSPEHYATLVAYPAPFHKYPEPFLCLVGMIQMDLLSFIRTADPTKVRIGERQRDEDEPKILETTIGHVVPLLPVAPDQTSVKDVAPVQLKRQKKRKTKVADAGEPSHPAKKLRNDYGAPGGPTVGEESEEITNLYGAPIARKLAPARSSVWSPPSRSSVVDTEDETNGKNVTNGFCLDDSSVCREMVDEFAPPKFFTSVCGMDHYQLFTEFNVGAARQISLSAEVRMHAEYNIKERRRLNSVVEEKDSLLKARCEEIESLKAQLLVKETEAAEAIHLRAEASKFEILEKSLPDETQVLKECNAALEKEKSELEIQVTDLAASVKIREQEVSYLDVVVTSVKLQNDSHADQVHKLEASSAGLQEKVTVYENCMSQLEKFQDEKIEEVNEKFDKLCVDFVEMALHLEEKFYPHPLTTISGHRWLLTHGMELVIAKCLNYTEYLYALVTAIGKAIEKGMQDGLSVGITYGAEGRKLSDVAAYNLSTEADYLFVLQRIQKIADKYSHQMCNYDSSLLNKGMVLDTYEMEPDMQQW